MNKNQGELIMAIINKDEVKGKYEQAKGTVKDKAGELTGNERLEAEGEAQHAKGDVQESWGKVKRNVSNAVEDVADAINK
jgi:uncharacterized protein YjbJ (UPF0337 family)